MASHSVQQEPSEFEYPTNHLFGLLDDLLIYIMNFLKVETVIELKSVSKYLNYTVSSNNQCFHHFHMATLERMFTKTKDEQTRFQIMNSFSSIKSLETIINLYNFIPMSHTLSKDSKLLKELPDSSFYEEFLTRFLQSQRKLEHLAINGCFDDIASKLPFQVRLKSLVIRNTESSGLISTFFSRLLTSQFELDATANPTDDPTDDAISDNEDGANNQNDPIHSNHSDSKYSNQSKWCRILAKGSSHTLNSLKIFNFCVCPQTLCYLSRFLHIHTLHIQYEEIDFISNPMSLQHDEDLNESLDLIQSKTKMICTKSNGNSEEDQWSILEPFIALLFRNILCLKDVKLCGEEETITGQDTLSLLLLYYVLLFHGEHLQSLSVRISVEQTMKYQVDYQQMAIYHHLIATPFTFNVKSFRTFRLKMVTPSRSRHRDDDDQNGMALGNGTDNGMENGTECKGDEITDVIRKYGHHTQQSLYISEKLPLSLQMMVSLFRRFEDDHNELQHNIQDLCVMIDSADWRLGFEYGFVIAKAMQALRPRNMVLAMSMSDFDRRESELFIQCLCAVAEWNVLFLQQCDHQKVVESLTIRVSCFSTVSMKSMSEFCVGVDGQDMRMSNALNVEFSSFD